MKNVLFALLLLCATSALSAATGDNDSGLSTSHTGSGNSKDEACAMARSSAGIGSQVSGSCADCEMRGNTHVCYVDSGEVAAQSRARITPVPAQPVQPNAQSCQELVRYGASTLAQDIDKSLRAIDAPKRSLSALADLDNQMRVQKPKMLGSGVLRNVLLRLRTTAGVIGDRLAIDPGIGAPMAPDSLEGRDLQAGFSADDGRSQAEAVFHDDLKEYILLEFAADLRSVDGALRELARHGANAQNVSRSNNDIRDTWRAVEMASANLRKQIVSLDQKMHSQQSRNGLISQLKSAIDLQCKEKPSERMRLSRASATTQAEACERTKYIAGSDGNSGECACRAGGPGVICEVQTPGLAPGLALSFSPIPFVKGFLREWLKCDPATEECRRRKTVSMGGIRG